jgi:hypothetical protein
MMSYTRERDEFIVAATKAGLDIETSRKLLRYATTLQRLAVAECNGDWPADNGERKVDYCPKCQSGYVPASFRPVVVEEVPYADGKGVRRKRERRCPSCYAESKVEQLLAKTELQPAFNGDPRGAVLRLVPRGTSHEDANNGRVRGIYVPPSVR